ncbi:CDP-alcohol phosphatidyltransferase family protein [Haloferula sp.]|jgi:phosphatidylglycerophosphate synthase|uniref:CDP-alcohol phosphatidyltransferase family protein n=1 Tax=Haloferula sp. TaxID=2497595 RepID=UPI003C785308
MITIKQQIENRRPLALRELGCWTWLLKKAAGTGITPNQISVLGMIFGLAAGALLYLTPSLKNGSPIQRSILLAGILAIILRGACNIFDGVLAVETKRASRVGLLYNEVPDRISDIAILAGAGYAIGSHPTLGWAAALGAVVTACIRNQVQLAGASPDYSGPMAKPARMVVVCLAMASLALLPLNDWKLSFSGQGIGPIGISLALVVVGTFVTSIVRLRHAAIELNQGTLDS